MELVGWELPVEVVGWELAVVVIGEPLEMCRVCQAKCREACMEDCSGSCIQMHVETCGVETWEEEIHWWCVDVYENGWNRDCWMPVGCQVAWHCNWEDWDP